MSHAGTHVKYSQGCRCQPCREAHRVYERNRKRQRMRPDGKGTTYQLVDATEVRKHLRWLATKGAGYRQLSKISGVSPSSIALIRSGKVTTVRDSTARKLLGVHAGLLLSNNLKRYPTSIPSYLKGSPIHE